jgi:putative transcriptional regulator
MQSLKGQLILDGGKLTGSEFAHTVVLVCSHDHDGAFGLVLNRPSDQQVGESLPEELPDALRQLSLYVGGPVSPRLLSCLIHEPDNTAVGKETVLPGLRLAHTLDELLDANGELPARTKVKFFAGYAGWAAGQLDNEMKQQAWLTHPAALDHVFHARPRELWRTILRTKGPAFRLLAESPDDASLN